MRARRTAITPVTRNADWRSAGPPQRLSATARFRCVPLGNPISRLRAAGPRSMQKCGKDGVSDYS
jgi:hypothetical protein